ncbi:MAG: hypothetical protein AB4050_19445 [Synechococcus sp.]
MTDSYIIGISLVSIVLLQIYLVFKDKAKGLLSLSQMLSITLSLFALAGAVDIVFFLLSSEEINDLIGSRRLILMLLGQLSLVWLSISSIIHTVTESE